MLGIPSYGYISKSSASTLQTRARRTTTSKQAYNDDDGGVDGGQVQFRSLVDQGVLVRNPDGPGSRPQFVGGGGFERYWDECSSTTYLRSPSAGQVITYDDPESLAAKAAFARRMGMKGVNFFDVHGDVDDWALTDAVRKELGLQ